MTRIPMVAGARSATQHTGVHGPLARLQRLAAENDGYIPLGRPLAELLGSTSPALPPVWAINPRKT